MIRVALLTLLGACLPALPQDDTAKGTVGPYAAGDADVILTGEAEDDALGSASVGFAEAGDFDGDGDDDLALITYSGDRAGIDAGAVYVFSHGPNNGSVSAAATVWTGVRAGDLAGYGAATADVDGDGDDDLLIGAVRNADGHGYWTGAVYAVLDPLTGGGSLAGAGAVVYGEAGEDLAGQDIANLGDWDGDGTDEVLIGAPYSERGAAYGGAGYVMSGPLTGEMSLATRDLELYGEGDYDRLGECVAAVDLNADGVTDALVGSLFYRGGNTVKYGGVVALFGPASGAVGSGSADIEWTGDVDGAGLAGYQAMRAIGDVDGDGYDDVGIAAFTDATGTTAGILYVVSSASAGSGTIGSVASATFYGEADAGGAGQEIAGVGDVDGDGTNDLLTSAYLADGVAADSGRGYLVLGPRSGANDLGDEILFEGEAELDVFGGAASAGDQDGDGRPDLLFGGALNDRGVRNAGTAYLFYASSL